jgi:hypothetical protein
MNSAQGEALFSFGRKIAMMGREMTSHLKPASRSVLT